MIAINNDVSAQRLNSKSCLPVVITMLKKEVNRIVSEEFSKVDGQETRNLSIHNLKNNTELTQVMKMLAAAGVVDVICCN